MAPRLFILRQVADFAPGFFENTVVENGCIQLGRFGEQYMQQGIYTTPPYTAEAFFSLIPSWNADTPPGTTIELQVRISGEGLWSRWFSFGTWSPFIHRASPAPQQDDIAQYSGEYLRVADGMPAADLLQLRILLRTEDPALSPSVYLLAASTDASHMQQTTQAYERTLHLPAYSCQTRDPALSEYIPSATALTMLLNRYGRDLLPEEVARATCDNGASTYGNLAFLSAVAGMYGFSSYIAYSSLSSLRHEIWQGRAVLARVHYRAPMLATVEEEPANHRPLPPIWEEAEQNSSGHFLAIYGFTSHDGVAYVQVHDPMALSDATVKKEIPVAAFSKMYTGIALYLEKGPQRSGSARPTRTLAQLEIHDNLLRLYHGEEELVPARLLGEYAGSATLCYTLSDDIAYPSAAMRKFYYPLPDEHGAVRFDYAAAGGRRITVYLIGPQGQCWVAEKQLPLPEGDTPLI